MRYFLIAGEASGDLHASHLMKSLKAIDPEAQFDFLGGNLMGQVAGKRPIIHYCDMAYMGFIEVAKHLRSILGFMKKAKREIERIRPDAVILVDYPSFNLKIAKHAHKLGIPVHYFISPKVWVWKEWRVKDIKRYVDHMHCILPFEVDFYKKHDYAVNYVGNPTVSEITAALPSLPDAKEFKRQQGLEDKPIIALVPGSRTKEINDNLPAMLRAAARHPEYQAVIASAPSVDPKLYYSILDSMGSQALMVENATWDLVRNARVALVTSGTATLETAVLGTPQVACYRMNGSKFIYKFYRRLLKGNYVTLPNLVADEPIIPELLLHLCTEDTIDEHLTALLQDGDQRNAMLQGYDRMMARLGTNDSTATAARNIIASLKN
ncbi:MAG: lipid-A-disaccharide synthase [Muribaculaceae bacterium]|nr:lipid-A-disaccharide synthase [Muribaculaceae bacterium]